MYAEMDEWHLLETILKIYFVLNATQKDKFTGIRNDTVSYQLYDGLLIF